MILDRSLVGFGKLYLQILPSTKTNKQTKIDDFFLYTVHYGRDLQDFVQKLFHLFGLKPVDFIINPFFHFCRPDICNHLVLKLIIEK